MSAVHERPTTKEKTEMTSIESIRSSVHENRVELMSIMLEHDEEGMPMAEWADAIYNAYALLGKVEGYLELALVVE